MVRKLSKARLRFVIVIVQSKTKIAQTMHIVQSAARILVKLFQSRLDSSVFDHGRRIWENAKRGNFKTSFKRQVTKSYYF